jgi:hypothetical protein
MHLLHRLWQFSVIAYDRPKGDEKLFQGKVSFTAMARGLDFGYIVEFPDEVIIAFRGTGTRTSDGIKCIKTWLSDLDLFPLRDEVKLAECGRSTHEVLVGADILSDGVWGRGMIHNGFYTTWAKFKDEVSANSEKFKGKPVYCIGHSRGGALAELCARHIAKNLKLSCSCVEYGTPCVGTAEYVRQFRTLSIDATAVVNGYDLVPDLPPERLGFENGPAHKVNLKQPWWHRIFSRIRDHFEENYTAALEKYYP